MVNQPLLDYLSTLTGEPVAPDRPLQLRSVQRAALASWCRKQKIEFSFALIRPGKQFLVHELFAVEGPATNGSPDAPVSTRAPSAGGSGSRVAAPILGVGIDIEEVRNLPHADDYREHPFFTDHFTPAEIAYCVRQGDVRASLCGLWAAKEAIVKTGVATSLDGRLRGIEITRTAADQPSFDRCQISISHTPTTAVAVCLALA